MQLVYLSPVPWSSFAQRPHKFVEWFHARSGDRVLWIDPYPTRFPEFSDFRRAVAASTTQEQDAVQAHCPQWLTVVRPNALPIEPCPGSGIANRLLWSAVLNQAASFLANKNSCLGIGKPSELALQLLRQHPDVFTFYDAMDDFAAFYTGLSSHAMNRRENAIASRVSRLMVSSTALLKKFSGDSAKPILAHNACAIETLPPVAKSIQDRNSLVLGYVGTIASWFDWPLVVKLANANPESTVRLIGPVYTAPPAPLPKNIELLPACSHPVAIAMMQEFSAGLIPFKNNALTTCVDPVKYYEYRAIGLPVISTSFGEMAFRGNQDGIFLVGEDIKLDKMLERTQGHRLDARHIEKFRLENNWHARFDAADLFSAAPVSLSR